MDVPTPVLLQQYFDVFNEPQTLLPSQSHDHAITLQQRAGPINVCPYRYPHHQNIEIEKLVQHILLARIIQ